MTFWLILKLPAPWPSSKQLRRQFIILLHSISNGCSVLAFDDMAWIEVLLMGDSLGSCKGEKCLKKVGLDAAKIIYSSPLLRVSQYYVCEAWKIVFRNLALKQHIVFLFKMAHSGQNLKTKWSQNNFSGVLKVKKCYFCASLSAKIWKITKNGRAKIQKVNFSGHVRICNL